LSKRLLVHRSDGFEVECCFSTNDERHQFPQFVVVMLSCRTVAMDTQTKYGP
jgi:hypothetical protein